MAEGLAGERALVGGLVGDQPAAWDLAGELPVDLLRELGAEGILCAEVPAGVGGLGARSHDQGVLGADAAGDHPPRKESQPGPSSGSATGSSGGATWPS